MVLYYTNQCPHTDKYAPLIAEIARTKGQSIALIKIESKEQAQNAPAPFTTYSFFYNGRFVTNEIFSENKFAKFLEEIGVWKAAKKFFYAGHKSSSITLINDNANKVNEIVQTKINNKEGVFYDKKQ